MAVPRDSRSQFAVLAACVSAVSVTGFALTATETAPLGPPLTVWRVPNPGEPIVSLTADEAGRWIAVTTRAPNGGARHRIVVVNLRDGRTVREFEAPGQPVVACLSPRGDVLALGASGTITVYGLSGNRERVIANAVNHAEALGLSSDGRTLVAGPVAPHIFGYDKLRAWNVETGEELPFRRGAYRWSGPALSWSRPVLSLDGSTLAAGGWPGPTPRVFDRWSGKRITYCFYEEWPACVALSPNGKRLVSVHEDGALIVWEIRPTGNENARQLLKLAGFGGTRAMAFAERGRILAYATDDGQVRLRRFRW